MPAFGKNGLVNLNQSAGKEVWKVKDPDGKTLMVCDNQAQAEIHKISLSQKMNKQCVVERGEAKCL
jgi:hypothetical protein